MTHTSNVQILKHPSPCSGAKMLRCDESFKVLCALKKRFTKKFILIIMPEILNDETVVLNVGGILYTSTRSTLSRSPLLKQLLVENSNELFIDRDPSSFFFVLNYLRTGLIIQDPVDKHYVNFLINEASIYGLEKMVEKLNDFL